MTDRITTKDSQHRRGTLSSYLRAQRRIRDIYEYKVDESNGLPVSLSCINKSSSTTTNTISNATPQLLNTTILFDYELSLRDPEEDIVEVLRQDLPKWEFFLLYYVADDIGLVGCSDIDQQNISNFSNNTDTTNSTNVTLSKRLPTEVIKLSSYGQDVVDTRVDTCQLLVNLEPGFICLPLKGIMTAEFLGLESDRQAVESFLAYHISSVINSGKFGVDQTSFVGSRIIPAPAPVVQDDSRSVDDNASNDDVTVALASTLSVAAVFLILLVYFAVAKRKPRRSNNANDVVDQSEVTSKHVPVGVLETDFDMQQPEEVTNNATKSIDSVSEGDKTDDARCGSVETTNRLGREVIENPTSDTAIAPPYSLANIRTASTVLSTDDSDIYIEDDETAKVNNVTDNTEDNIVPIIKSIEPPPAAMIDALPPKHPTGPSSKTLLPVAAVAKVPKKQRRRKKKKKKAAIVRSNSRENMREMETITEVEEETSGDNHDLDDQESDDDDGSWCSTSDSDPGSSRDPSPARSSRDPSPARSIGTSAAVASDPNIITAASNLNWDTTTNIGPSPDRTLGTDKPKTKRLPPSWI